VVLAVTLLLRPR